ncbi:MAG: 3-oxoacyl-ACP reductase FabG [Nevskiaceae bacterium]|nr:MAG: 3-oxoacyl-ACP reductase FabG [Nevskiaceae bacterium]TBR74822.1 MAG: 3-oxoacyl-ACP reductase FabG [Nevskiaceae bacterium]
MKLEGQIALVTGASRGIGQAIAQRLAADGARVVGTATTEAGAAAIAAALQPHGGEGRVLDVSKPQGLEDWFKALATDVGPIGILVNNAGITRDGLAMRMKDEDWDAVIGTNLTGTFRLCRTALPAMLKARYGRIVNVGSVVAAMGNPGQANYCAAKAGLAGLSRSLAKEVGRRGVTVNVVAPGFIATDMTAALGDKARDALLAQVPAGRLGTVEDIAAAVAFLASAEAGYINGETLNVNGGLYMN